MKVTLSPTIRGLGGLLAEVVLARANVPDARRDIGNPSLDDPAGHEEGMTMLDRNDPDGGGWTARGDNWTTSISAEWLNTLARGEDVPDLSSGRVPVTLTNTIFEEAATRLRADISALEFQAIDALPKRSLQIWRAVCRKTLDLKKLAEKMPRTFFLHGQRDKNSPRLMLRHDRAPFLPPCGVDDRHLDQAIRDAITRGWLGRSPSEHDRRYGTSHIYTPWPAAYLIERLFEWAEVVAAEKGPGQLVRAHVGLYRRETLRLCADMLQPLPPGSSPTPIPESARRRHRSVARES